MYTSGTRMTVAHAHYLPATLPLTSKQMQAKTTPANLTPNHKTHASQPCCQCALFLFGISHIPDRKRRTPAHKHTQNAPISVGRRAASGGSDRGRRRSSSSRRRVPKIQLAQCAREEKENEEKGEVEADEDVG